MGIFFLWISYRLFFLFIISPDDVPSRLGVGLFFLGAGVFLLPFPFMDRFLKRAWIKLTPFFSRLFRLSPYLVLLLGSIWIAWILFNPPLYVTSGGTKYPYDPDIDYTIKLYPTPDYITVILHSVGIAVITAMIFYLLKKVTATKTKSE